MESSEELTRRLWNDAHTRNGYLNGRAFEAVGPLAAWLIEAGRIERAAAVEAWNGPTPREAICELVQRATKQIADEVSASNGDRTDRFSLFLEADGLRLVQDYTWFLFEAVRIAPDASQNRTPALELTLDMIAALCPHAGAVLDFETWESEFLLCGAAEWMDEYAPSIEAFMSMEGEGEPDWDGDYLGALLHYSGTSAKTVYEQLALVRAMGSYWRERAERREHLRVNDWRIRVEIEATGIDDSWGDLLRDTAEHLDAWVGVDERLDGEAWDGASPEMRGVVMLTEGATSDVLDAVGAYEMEAGEPPSCVFPMGGGDSRELLETTLERIKRLVTANRLLARFETVLENRQC